VFKSGLSLQEKFAMPWNEADRAKDDVIRERCSTDMSDAEFERVSALLPPPKVRGREAGRFRAILNALFCMVPRRLSVAVAAEGFSAFHDRSKQILGLARQRICGPQSSACW
jgi:hypothetical protein